MAADDVRLQPGAEAQLTPAQRAAIRQWRAYVEASVDGVLEQAPRAPLAAAQASGTDRPTACAAGVALLALLGAAWIWTPGAAVRSYAAVAGAVIIGVLAGSTAGRIGPGSSIRLRHATTIKQLGEQSVVSMRATAQYPTAAAFEIRVEGFEGELRSRGGSEQWLDAEDRPVHRGTWGRGAREQLELDGVTDYAPFEVSTQGDVVQVRNRTTTTLTGCAFPEGFTATGGGSLAPNASVSARSVTPVAAPFFSCAGAALPLTFTDARFPIDARGSTVVSVRLPVAAPADAVSE